MPKPHSFSIRIGPFIRPNRGRQGREQKITEKSSEVWLLLTCCCNCLLSHLSARCLPFLYPCFDIYFPRFIKNEEQPNKEHHCRALLPREIKRSRQIATTGFGPLLKILGFSLIPPLILPPSSPCLLFSFVHSLSLLMPQPKSNAKSR